MIYNEQKDATLLSPSGESFILGHKFTEAEFTAIRTIFAGRAAKLEGDVIRRRLRETYV